MFALAILLSYVPTVDADLYLNLLPVHASPRLIVDSPGTPRAKQSLLS